MDIFKLLSRSTKPTHKPGSVATGQASKVPSSGASTNPQLYLDPVPEIRGTKRKRFDRVVEADSVPISDEELNFFAPKTEQQKTTDREQRKHGDDVYTGGRSKPSKLFAESPNWLEEEECRQILKSHRVKVTVLPSTKPKDTLPEKSGKKSKKMRREDETRKHKKEEHLQLYPQPLLAFDDLQSIYGISRRLCENVTKQGYKTPTEVQMGSLPLLLRPDIVFGTSSEIGNLGTGIDFLAVAPTGSGKTLAFLIPVMNSIIQRRRDSKVRDSHLLEAIVVAPTKELASQIVNEGRKLALGTGVKVVGMKKGMNIVEDSRSENESASEESQQDDEEDDARTARTMSSPMAKADILVTTPLVLLHSISVSSAEGKSSLPTVRYLILDEADILLDPLFREQTLGIWEACVNPQLNVTLWSATMGSSIEALASQTIDSRRQQLNLKVSTRPVRLVVGLKDSAIPNITHQLIYAANEPGKLLALRQLLRPTAKSNSTSPSLRPPFLIFTQTIPRAIALHSELLYDIPTEAGGSSRIAVLHSDLSDSARDHVMTRFRNGEIWILITTDILSRGVDFRGINGVVNYDVPNSGAAYVHRVGRTGRAGRDGGIAVTFYANEDIPYVKVVANIIAASEKQAGKTEGEGGVQKWLLDALPTPSKKEKKNLRLHGVEARRTVGRNGDVGKAKISTKSGFERKLENNRRGAVQGSKRRAQAEKDSDGGEESEWDGIGE